MVKGQHSCLYVYLYRYPKSPGLCFHKSGNKDYTCAITVEEDRTMVYRRMYQDDLLPSSDTKLIFPDYKNTLYKDERFHSALFITISLFSSMVLQYIIIIFLLYSYYVVEKPATCCGKINNLLWKNPQPCLSL